MNHTMKKGKTTKQASEEVVNTSHGFTLVEVMTVLVIISILALFAAPEVMNWRPKMRLKGAADALSENLQRAKMHAIKNNVSVVFTFAPGTGAPASTCTGGSYTFIDNAAIPNTVASETLNDPTTPESMARTAGLCLQVSTFNILNIPPNPSEGFSSRGLSLGGGGTITLSSADLIDTNDPTKNTLTYVITQTLSGGIQLLKVLYP